MASFYAGGHGDRGHNMGKEAPNKPLWKPIIPL